jgi:hypothetical protein
VATNGRSAGSVPGSFGGSWTGEPTVSPLQRHLRRRRLRRPWRGRSQPQTRSRFDNLLLFGSGGRTESPYCLEPLDEEKLLDITGDHGVQLLMDSEIAHHRLVIVLEVEKTTLRPELFTDLLFCFFARLRFAPSYQLAFNDVIAVSSSEVSEVIGSEILFSPHEACDILHKLKLAHAARCIFFDEVPI